MSDLIEKDPHVPLYFAAQNEYREEVRRNKLDHEGRTS